MKHTHYKTFPLTADDFIWYRNFLHIGYACKFYSEGRNGRFELRLVISTQKHNKKRKHYNLAFGVWDEHYQDINDLLETRNGDFQTILATVGMKALEFLQANPKAELFAEGSTPARTRLYQREIGKVIDDIPQQLKIEGVVRKHGTGYIKFQKGINFDAFLLTAK